MTDTKIGNEENLAKIKDLMDKASSVNRGGKLTESIAIDYTSQYGTEYKGTVVFKRPTMNDYMKMGSYKAKFLGANGAVNLDLVDGTIKFMAQVMSTLKVVIAKAPEWLIKNGVIAVEDIEEPDVLYYLYGKYEEWEDSFRKNVSNEHEGDSEASE